MTGEEARWGATRTTGAVGRVVGGFRIHSQPCKFCLNDCSLIVAGRGELLLDNLLLDHNLITRPPLGRVLTAWATL